MTSGLRSLAAPPLQEHLDDVVIDVAVNTAPGHGDAVPTGGAKRFDAAALRAEMLAELRALSYDDAATTPDRARGV